MSSILESLEAEKERKVQQEKPLSINTMLINVSAAPLTPSGIQLVEWDRYRAKTKALQRSVTFEDVIRIGSSPKSPNLKGIDALLYRLFQKFATFLEKARAAENLSFISRVRQLEETLKRATEDEKESQEMQKTDSYQRIFKKTYEEEVLKGELNLSAENKGALDAEAVDYEKGIKHFTLEKFKDAREELEKMLKEDSFLSFSRTDVFQNDPYVKHINTINIINNLRQALDKYLNENRAKFRSCFKGKNRKLMAIYDKLNNLNEKLKKLLQDENSSLDQFLSVLDTGLTLQWPTGGPVLLVNYLPDNIKKVLLPKMRESIVSGIESQASEPSKPLSIPTF
jgi:hypothetical protein